VYTCIYTEQLTLYRFREDFDEIVAYFDVGQDATVVGCKPVYILTQVE